MRHDQDVHARQPLFRAGVAISDARLAAVLLHGRGGTAEDFLGLSVQIAAHDVAYIAPQAADHTWYPYSFLAPIERNEPDLSSALGVIARVLNDLQQQHNVPPEKVVLLGFSQGACLALEFAARHARRYAGIVALSGGLIGPPGTPRNYQGSFSATPVFLGCSDVDSHIPVERVYESAEVFRQMGAVVDEHIYPGMGHTINADEITAINALLSPTA